MGEFRIDHATIAFRLALAEASEQEQARADALKALWPRSVFAATWPSPNEAPRTLTNSHGETALPLFTGLDTLEVGADRFSWREPNGSIRFREMPVREALRYALTRQVNFVVLDVGFEHNVEFAREEFEPLVLQMEARSAVSQTRQAAVGDNTRRAPASPPSAASMPVAAPGLSGQAPVRPQVSGAAPRQQPSAAARNRPAASAAPQPQQQAASVWPHPLPHDSLAADQRPVPASTQPRALATPAPPRPPEQRPPSDAPAGRSRAAQASGAHETVAPPKHASSAPPKAVPPPKHISSVPPNLPLPAPANDVGASPRLQSGSVPIQQPEQPAASARQRSGAVPIQQPVAAPPPAAAAPSAAPPQNAPIKRPPRRPTISGSPPPPTAYASVQQESVSPRPTGRDAEPPAPRPQTPMPRQRVTLTQSEFVAPVDPALSSSPRPHSRTTPIHTESAAPPPAPRYGTPLPTTPPPRAAATDRRTPPPVPDAAKARAPESPIPPRVEIEANPLEARRRSRDDEPTLAERPNRANTLRGVQASVPESTLEALSSELRGFPEVEWACVLLDESDVPLIGVRIDPSFLNRVADITDVILDVGERQSVTLQVLLLNNQDLVKNARRNGRAFYPWAEPPR
jgi:hypothetical protein